MNTNTCGLCLDKIVELFKGDCQCAAIAVAVVAFVAGMIAMCVLCKAVRLCCRCGKSCGKKDAAKAKRSDRPFEKRRPHLAPADGSVEIYVGNLSYDMTEANLRKTFEEYGKVNSARLITNRVTGKSKGFGFVQMPNREEAEKAIAALDNKDILGRKMRCNEAKNLI